MLIDFEGIDGSGKRTQSKLLKKELLKKGFKVADFSYPDYDSEYGKLIKGFLEAKLNLSSDEQFLLYLIDIVKNKEEVKQKLRKGHMVIMDRYFLSTIAYQSANNFDYEVAKAVTKLIQLPLPSVIFYIEIPLEIASRRKSKQKGIVDRFEGNTEFLTKVVNVYERLIKEQFPSSNWILLDGTEEPEVLNKKILLKLEELIKRGV